MFLQPITCTNHVLLNLQPANFDLPWDGAGTAKLPCPHCGHGRKHVDHLPWRSHTLGGDGNVCSLLCASSEVACYPIIRVSA